MYRGVFPIWLDGQTAKYKDADNIEVTGHSVEHGSSVVISATGGKNGPVITTLHMVKDELYLTTVLTDKGGISASRVFARN